MKITIIGASSGPGRLLYDELMAESIPVVGIARNRKGVSTSSTAQFFELDAQNSSALRDLIKKDTTLVHCARPEILTSLLGLNPDIHRLIALGSTRIYTKFPDEKYAQLVQMSEAIWRSNINASLLHPTMIYGAPGLNNIERVIRVARVSPFIPLPNNGEALIQPVSADDVVRAIRACIRNKMTIGKTITVPGKKPITYRRFIELCLKYAGIKSRIISVPFTFLSFLAHLTRLLPGIPTIKQEEIRRLLEDKDYSTEGLKPLGLEPTEIEKGLRLLQLNNGVKHQL